MIKIKIPARMRSKGGREIKKKRARARAGGGKLGEEEGEGMRKGGREAV